MFSRKDQLLRKTGPDGIGRFDFLRLLKKEFQETIQEDSKNQILANLANFAYDPINYDYMRSLNLLDLFLEQFKSGNEELIHYSSAAICNLSADPTNRDIIIRKNGITLVAKLLYSKDEEVVLNCITTLMFLRTEETDFEIRSSGLINKMQELKKYGGPRLRNLATLYLEQ